MKSILQITVAFAVVALGESFLPPKTTQPVNPCSKVLCMAGTKCVVQNGKPRCVQG
ncbi:Hypothetical predicted protein [Paramuricea clavata]|uniref:Uncharacterized protein n=1 Tax=Paramuricea clavata TaxID=317549 RepID=A0A6S7GIC3_PARCT|nr:Hypothetical predicted protein [Paramuricea clavata]